MEILFLNSLNEFLTNIKKKKLQFGGISKRCYTRSMFKPTPCFRMGHQTDSSLPLSQLRLVYLWLFSMLLCQGIHEYHYCGTFLLPTVN